MFNTQPQPKTYLKGAALGAVLASLALHALALWAWGNRPPETVTPIERPQLTWVDVQTVPAPASPPETEPKPAPLSKTRTPVSAPPVRVKASPTRATPADAPVRAPQLAIEPMLPNTVTPSTIAVAIPDAGVTVEENVAQWTRQAVGEQRAQSGLVHTYYATLGKALLKGWDADRPLKTTGLQAYREQFVENTRIWNNIWQQHAEVFGKSGSPFIEAPPTANRRAPVNDRSPLGTVDAVDKRALNKQMRETFKATRRAKVKVTQDATGKLLDVKLIEPSHDANVDREAVADIRAAAERLPVPPTELAKEGAQLVSIWNFELVISITPPIPTFSFEFDEAVGFIDARLPLDRRIYKKVRLVSVE